MAASLLEVVAVAIMQHTEVKALPSTKQFGDLLASHVRGLTGRPGAPS
jgi:hypothetical protein